MLSLCSPPQRWLLRGMFYLGSPRSLPEALGGKGLPLGKNPLSTRLPPPSTGSTFVPPKGWGVSNASISSLTPSKQSCHFLEQRQERRRQAGRPPLPSCLPLGTGTLRQWTLMIKTLLSWLHPHPNPRRQA